jgi:SAM-dependent methyltransferase
VNALNGHSLEQRRQAIIESHGPWTAHNLELAAGVYTMDDRIVGDEVKLRRVMQVVADMAGKPLAEMRVLDLACLEGLYAIEFARHGASVMAIEGRAANLAKVQFAKEVLALGNLELIQGDVREIRREQLGEFAVILCLGILYHLDAPDLLPFLSSIAEMCRRITVIDTHVSLLPEDSREFAGRTYWGKDFREHAPKSSAVDREAAAWSTLDNLRSFWLTRPSLFNALSHVGFTSTYECHHPPEPSKPPDRLTLAALKGPRQQLLSCPLMNSISLEDRRE